MGFFFYLSLLIEAKRYGWQAMFSMLINSFERCRPYAKALCCNHIDGIAKPSYFEFLNACRTAAEHLTYNQKTIKVRIMHLV